MQGSKLYVGNLDYGATTEEVRELFSEYGEVKNVNIIEGKGFGFVEMVSQAEAEEAKKNLNNSEFKGRNLRVDEARPPKERPRGRRDDNRRPRDRNKGGGRSRRY